MKKKAVWILSAVVALSAALTLFVYSKKGKAQPSAFVLGTNAGSYLKNEYVTYKIFGAPPNSPIYWTSERNGQPTGEVDAYYDQMTDSEGNWEGEVGPWTSADYGNWLKHAKVGGIVSTTGFSVIEGDIWSCQAPVSDCLRIAKEKGSTNVWVAPLLSDGYGMTTNFDKVKDGLLVVHATKWIDHYPVHDTELDRIITYSRYKVDILRQPPHPCTQCSSPRTLPPGVSAGDGEMLIMVPGGTVTIDGVTLFDDYRYIPSTAEHVFLLIQNEYNPRLAGLATGRSSAYDISYHTEDYPTRYVTLSDLLGPIDSERYHPLIELNVVPNDPKSRLDIKLSDFINRLNN